MKVRHTPESAEVLAVRCEYDREVYQLRKEITDLREQLAGDGLGWRVYAPLVLSFVIGFVAGCLVWAVTP